MNDGIIQAGKDLGRDLPKDEITPHIMGQIKSLVEQGQTISSALKRLGYKACCTKVEPVQRRMLEHYGVEFRNTLIINDIKRLTQNLSEVDIKEVARALQDHILMLGNN